ncbi:isopentenyl-diphosphate Delta-isomerase [Apibacter muscae]|uniref:isopentenyl-diphosphate Delta-isomerase n=1 Tax=Apibacter muscae TaxID=2509004 RepID=UPI0011ADEF19|nr:isopentenyl-diphosphate Delta-isomerase [Apibacter muscae]TWP29967.1 isopentenyl-diphosphate Delta-isomerase [Apibacter muscae]
MEHVILVNNRDEVIGEMEKQEAHIQGVLHRAFSVFIFNSNQELLLQQRASTKYHSPLKWTNTCCSHPRKGESYLKAAHRRLHEELNFDCDLYEKFYFIYKADVGDGLIEHEFDRVFIGEYSGKINFNRNEVASVKWMSLLDLKNDLKLNPNHYTEWFKIIFNQYEYQIQYHKF